MAYLVDMALNKRTIAELTTEHKQLLARQEKLQTELDECRRLAEAISQILPQQGGPQGPVSRADLIRDALRALGGDSSSEQIAKEMLRQGFIWEGKGDLSSIVNGELHRMAKGKLGVRRVNRGKYSYVG